jgi:ABC-type branched-subunit amino acid transport system substrate-binding protein
VLVIADAVERVAKSGKSLTRAGIREALEETNLERTLQGPIAYDENGDIKTRVIALYQVQDGKYKYIGIAPEK